MTANSKAKLKLLYIKQMLEEETDSEHGLTMQQIICRLEEVGISAERKGIYRDIDLLREFGMDIKLYQRNPAEYALDHRDFKLSELMLLVDSVESCKSLTRKQANTLEGNIKSLASINQQKSLERCINVTDRIKSKNESVFDEIDLIHEAMLRRRKICFKYMRYGIDGKRHATHNGEIYTVTPLDISYDDGFYYLSAWNETFDDFRTYRIDRMSGLRISEENATSNDRIRQRPQSNEDDYQSFGHFNGEKVNATLSVRGDKVEIVMDRFGKHAQISPDGENAKALVTVRKSEAFFGWIAGLGGLVTIAEPQDLLDEYRAYLKKLLEE